VRNARKGLRLVAPVVGAAVAARGDLTKRLSEAVQAVGEAVDAIELLAVLAASGTEHRAHVVGVHRVVWDVDAVPASLVVQSTGAIVVSTRPRPKGHAAAGQRTHRAASLCTRVQGIPLASSFAALALARHPGVARRRLAIPNLLGRADPHAVLPLCVCTASFVARAPMLIFHVARHAWLRAALGKCTTSPVRRAREVILRAIPNLHVRGRDDPRAVLPLCVCTASSVARAPIIIFLVARLAWHSATLAFCAAVPGLRARGLTTEVNGISSIIRSSGTENRAIPNLHVRGRDDPHAVLPLCVCTASFVARAPMLIFLVARHAWLRAALRKSAIFPVRRGWEVILRAIPNFPLRRLDPAAVPIVV